ncbi:MULTISPECIES: hypothetical protein [Bradyrhizobium]|uniref:hypothetical protein n=1 Tax=Bradyrhizobium TaxID=374 RepID=UPI0004ACE995|nr:hypothetical protein [Bradyrhizobium diazoefficiens]MBP1062818.1 hypothetical protein [Bradyrhizobium japonicum]QJS41135.1 hypothetical protein DI395_46595 [Bradyrhizobium diazoefficiens]QLD41474.1 hypothetical protein HUW42_10970 [Bradyrhizobium diazoefficiens]WLA75900.1 hypothetical protein QIH77_12170 [Bradyrhizobium diazoefficiens]WLB40325.1 hypothetical protein QIH78_11210 [Bradyrhizobium diazoefficiens]
MDFLGAFPQSNLNAVPAVRTAVEIGRAGHVIAFPGTMHPGEMNRPWLELKISGKALFFR